MLELSGTGLTAAFLAGAVSFVSPCVLPLVPGYVSYVAGHSAGSVDTEPAHRRRQAMGLGLYFVVGFSTIFMALGASATTLGQILLSYRYELNLVGGAIVMLLGLFMIGMAKVAVMQREFRFHLSVPGGRPLSAYVLGLAFGFRLDALHRADSRCHSYGQRRARQHPGRRHPARHLFRRAGYPVPARRRFYRPPDTTFTHHWTHRPAAAPGRGRRDDRDGARDDHGAAERAVVLAARRLSHPGTDWLTVPCNGDRPRGRKLSSIKQMRIYEQ